MKVDLQETTCDVVREPGDRSIRKFQPGTYDDYDEDSSFLHAVQKELRRQGHDFIKKRLWKDGFAKCPPGLQCLRTRSAGPGVQYILTPKQIHPAVIPYNRGSHVVLRVFSFEDGRIARCDKRPICPGTKTPHLHFAREPEMCLYISQMHGGPEDSMIAWPVLDFVAIGQGGDGFEPGNFNGPMRYPLEKMDRSALHRQDVRWHDRVPEGIEKEHRQFWGCPPGRRHLDL